MNQRDKKKTSTVNRLARVETKLDALAERGRTPQNDAHAATLAHRAARLNERVATRAAAPQLASARTENGRRVRSKTGFAAHLFLGPQSALIDEARGNAQDDSKPRRRKPGPGHHANRDAGHPTGRRAIRQTRRDLIQAATTDVGTTDTTAPGSSPDYAKYAPYALAALGAYLIMKE